MASNYYEWTIYNRETGELVVKGNASECADAIGILPSTFRQNRGYRIIEDLDPEYTGCRIWIGPKKPPTVQPMSVAERDRRKHVYDAKWKDAHKKRKPKQISSTLDKNCNGCIYLEYSYCNYKFCAYQRITGKSRLYKDISNPEEKRFDDPRVCHPGASCTAKITKEQECENHD